MNDFKLPDLGEGVHEGQIIRLCVAEGDEIREDEPLMEVETDKAAVEIPSPFTGTVQKWHVAEQQLVHVGDVMVTIGAGEAVAAAPAAVVEQKIAKAAPSSNLPEMPTRVTGRRKPASPAVRRLARQAGLDLEAIEGSGPGGRVTRADVERAASTPTPATAPAPSVTPAPAPTAHAAPVPIEAAVPEGTHETDSWGDVIRAPLSRPRKTIAANMTQAWTTIPHVTDSEDADVTLLDELRRNTNEAGLVTGKLSMLPFVVRAVAIALKRHPIFNATYDEAGEAIVYRRYIGIAVGVQSERGLIAPVLRNPDEMSIPTIHDQLMQMVEKVRTGRFEVNDTRGGTFTISNAGAMGGSRYSTPIVTPGQVAVLAIGRSRKLPWVVNDQVVPRLIMPLSLSFDHRIIDGAQEIAFQQEIIRMLETPGALLL